MEIERLLRIRWTPDHAIRPQILLTRGILNPLFPCSRLRPWRKRRYRHHLRTLRRVTEEPRLVNSRRRTSRRRMGRFLVQGPAALQGLQGRRRSSHERTRVETGLQRGRVEPPSAAGATPLVLFVPGLTMDALHIYLAF